MSRPRKRRRQPDQSSVGQSPTVSTYQTRIAVYEGRDRGEGDAALSAYAALYGKVQRKLFADVVAGRSAASLKSDYIKKHGIPARLFNGVRVSLEGKVASVRESQRLQQDSLQRRIARAQRQVSDAAERGRWDQVHQKNGGWPIFDTGWLDWKPTSRRAWYGCASGRGVALEASMPMMVR